jgi:hypothetical protein
MSPNPPEVEQECAELKRCLHELSHDLGVRRKGLVALLEGDLKWLQGRWCLSLDGGDDMVRDSLSVILEGHACNLYPYRYGQRVEDAEEIERYRLIARIGFNISPYPQLRHMSLLDRWLWFDPLHADKFKHHRHVPRPPISESTSRRQFRQVIDQIAERMVKADAAVGVPAKPEVALLSSSPRPAPRSGSSFAHLVDLSGELKDALNHVRDTCEAQHRALYTSDLVVTLLTLRGGRVARCFDEVQSGLSSTIRDQLAATLDPARHHEPFVPFAWLERADVQLAGQYAIADGKPIVTDLHLLLAILDGDSATNRWLQRLPEEKHQKIRAAVERHRHDGPTVINSPTPDGL